MTRSRRTGKEPVVRTVDEFSLHPSEKIRAFAARMSGASHRKIAADLGVDAATAERYVLEGLRLIPVDRRRAFIEEIMLARVASKLGPPRPGRLVR